MRKRPTTAPTAAAIAMNVAMMAAQAAADAAAAALTKQIGTDQPFIPPVGTPGMILVGSPNVMVGGFPLPNFSAIAQGLLKRVKGIKFEAGPASVVHRAVDKTGQPPCEAESVRTDA